MRRTKGRRPVVYLFLCGGGWLFLQLLQSNIKLVQEPLSLWVAEVGRVHCRLQIHRGTLPAFPVLRLCWLFSEHTDTALIIWDSDGQAQLRHDYTGWPAVKACDFPSTSNPKGIKVVIFLVLFPGKQKENSIFCQDRHSPAKYGT